MAKSYIKKPIPIQAIYWDGNTKEVFEFLGKEYDEKLHHNMGDIGIDTLEGRLYARTGDYIIKGIKGEFYPCRKDIFEESYEEVINDN